MKNAVTLFSELGERLGTFGEDAASRAVVGAACAANGWFQPEEICKTVSGHWEQLAGQYGLSRGAVEYMRPAFSLRP